MWEHPATQANAATLRARGATFVGPDHGELAEGEVGAGRMARPAAVAAAVARLLGPRRGSALAGRRVLVSAGGTREPLDPVRFLGNRSSGRMGVALADAALARGADVTTLLANAVVRPSGGTIVETPTAADLHAQALARGPSADVVLMAAAVADFRPTAVGDRKRPRDGAWLLELEPTVDVLALLGAARRDGQVLVGFAAETGIALDRVREKRARKGVDLIVANDVSRADVGFDVEANEVVLVTAEDERAVAKASKAETAEAILDRVEELLRCAG
jgi:phosphopantothenoylcysteine decarboxylase/phosphopantothenate--cysteine ligase